MKDWSLIYMADRIQTGMHGKANNPKCKFFVNRLGTNGP